MKITVNTNKKTGVFSDPTGWQNTTLRYAPPKDFPAYLAKELGRAKIMRVFITLDEFYELTEDKYYPNYVIGEPRVPLEKRFYPYEWKSIVKGPTSPRFEDYLTSHAKNADELMLNVRRLEREVLDGAMTYEKYTEVLENALEYSKRLAHNIRYIEFGNEIEFKSFGGVSASDYVKIYLVAYRVVKELNAKHNYEIPLEIGGYSAAYPINNFYLIHDVMELLSKSEIGACPMDFYSFHYYTCGVPAMIDAGFVDIAEMSDIEHLKFIYRQHLNMLEELNLPVKPVFLDEIGRASCTGVPAHNLYNASGTLTFLIAFERGDLGNMYPFPWCSFHHPAWQLSYTQFLYNDDGTYTITPFGLAIKILHTMRGEKLECEVENAIGNNAEYRTIATIEDEIITVLSINPTNETTPHSFYINGLSDGKYNVDVYTINEVTNNSLTAKEKWTGTLSLTDNFELSSKDGNAYFVLAFKRDQISKIIITKRA